MTDLLLRAVGGYGERHADADGVAVTPVPGFAVVRATHPTELQYAISRPLICLVLQGAKQVATGPRTLDFTAGETLIVTADVPTVSQITQASPDAPYLSVVLDLDTALIAELSAQMRTAPAKVGDQVVVEPTDADVADAALRLMRLIGRPAALPVLQAQLVREFHYWLLAGKHGQAIRRLNRPGGNAERIARAVALLRADFTQALPVERLAMVAGMSPSAFHQHFRKVTSLSPLQFQKQLRLIEARRLMVRDGIASSRAALAVGYESVPHFTREYRRMFGLPPARDAQAAQHDVGLRPDA